MKRLISLFWLLVLGSQTYSQSIDQVFVSKGDMKTPMQLIGFSFYSDPRIDRLDSLCITQFGSVTFLISGESKISEIKLSLGTPPIIKEILTTAVLSTEPYWMLPRKKKSVRITIPYYLVPSAICPLESRSNVIYPSAAQMFKYEGEYNSQVSGHTYGRVAETAAQGITLPILLLRGTTVCVFRK